MGATCCAPEAPTANVGPHNPYANINLVSPTSADYPVGQMNPPTNPYLQEQSYEKLQHNLDASNQIDPGMSPNMPYIVSPHPHYSANFTNMQSSVMTTRIGEPAMGESRNDPSYSVGVSENQSVQYVAMNSPHQPSPSMAYRVQLPKPTPEIQSRRKRLGIPHII